MRYGPVLAILMLAAVALAARARAAEPAPPMPGPPAPGPLPLCLRPELAALADALTLYVSFDADSLKPDLAEGPAFEPRFFPGDDKRATGPRFAPGLSGRALVLGSGQGLYPIAGNIPLESRGALAFWIQPHGWTRPNDGNVGFIIGGNGSFYLERQGPLADKDHRSLRNESTQFLVGDQSKRLVAALDYLPWENGRWYLVVANWSWPAFELSVDGQAFISQSLARVPPAGFFSDLLVGETGGTDRGLLDELMAFRRPLSLEEVRRLRRSGQWSVVGGQ